MLLGGSDGGKGVRVLGSRRENATECTLLNAEELDLSTMSKIPRYPVANAPQEASPYQASAMSAKQPSSETIQATNPQ